MSDDGPTWFEAQRDAIDDAEYRGDQVEADRLREQARARVTRQRRFYGIYDTDD